MLTAFTGAWWRFRGLDFPPDPWTGRQLRCTRFTPPHSGLPTSQVSSPRFGLKSAYPLRSEIAAFHVTLEVKPTLETKQRSGGSARTVLYILSHTQGHGGTACLPLQVQGAGP